VSWDQWDSDRGRWRTCLDCGAPYTDRIVHMRTHIDRPSDNHLTIDEAAAAVGRSAGTLRYWLKKGWLKKETKGRGNHRTWVTRKALKDFVEGEMAGDLRKAVKWAETGELKAGLQRG
jgi:hypothetical protein